MSIQKGGEGGRHCVSVVTGKAPSTPTPLEVRDVVLSLNGVTLADVEGGVQAWVKLFKVFDTGERNAMVVHRLEGGVWLVQQWHPPLRRTAVQTTRGRQRNPRRRRQSTP